MGILNALLRRVPGLPGSLYSDLIGYRGSEGQCGWLKDRWGLSWQVVPTRLLGLLSDPGPERARRAMEAMLSLGKLSIAELERAADGGGDLAAAGRVGCYSARMMRVAQ